LKLTKKHFFGVGLKKNEVVNIIKAIGWSPNVKKGIVQGYAGKRCTGRGKGVYMDLRESKRKGRWALFTGRGKCDKNKIAALSD